MPEHYSQVPDDQPVIILSHTYDAPRALVWEAWTKPEHLAFWWGPDNFTIEPVSADIRLGGHWQFVMIGPDGTRYPSYHTYTAFSPMDRIGYRHGESPEDPNAFTATADFAERGAKTAVTLHMTFPGMEARQSVVDFGAVEMGLQTLAKLDTHLVHMQPTARENRTGK